MEEVVTVEGWHNKKQSTSGPTGSNRNQKLGDENFKSKEDEDDYEIIPGYVLDLQVDDKVPWIKRMWVRAEYIRIYESVVDHYEAQIRKRDQALGGVILPPAAVVTGQPGIGKRVWLYYVLLKCLAEKRPVIWHYLKTPYIFVEEGVYCVCTNFLEVYFKSTVWTLVDSCQFGSSVPEEYVDPLTPFFVIYTTYPAKERWSHLHKTVFERVIVMNPWTRGEIHRAAQLCPDSPNSETINNVYDELGPTPHLCLDVASEPNKLKIYKDEIRTALKQLTLQGLQELIYPLRHHGLDMDDVSDKVCQIKRPDINNVDREFEISYITGNIRSRLASCMRNYDAHQQVKFYREYAHKRTRALASPIFESFFQQHFQRRIFIDYIPMIRLDQPEDDGQRNPQWQTCHNPVGNHELETKRQIALHQGATLDICPSDAYEYDDQDFRELVLEPNVLYLPRRQNTIVMDSFIYHNGNLFIFQFTTSEEHRINPQFISHFGECANFPPRLNWIFIFIIPDHVGVLKCPYSQSRELEELFPVSSQVKMEDYMTVVSTRDSDDDEPAHGRVCGLWSMTIVKV